MAKWVFITIKIEKNEDMFASRLYTLDWAWQQDGTHRAR
jgi:hypothetical protein